MFLVEVVLMVGRIKSDNIMQINETKRRLQFKYDNWQYKYVKLATSLVSIIIIIILIQYKKIIPKVI